MVNLGSGQAWTREIDARLAALHLAPERRAEIVEELSQHLDERYGDLRREGVSDAEARRIVLDELREPEALAAYLRPLRQAHTPLPITPGGPRRAVFADLWQDARYAARMLRRQPGFTAAAVLTLALGIGANTAIFSLFNATLFERMPVANRDRLAYVYRGGVGGVFPYPLYAAIRDRNDVLEGLAAWGGIEASLNADGRAELVTGYIVTGNFFELLGVRADQGRLLASSDDVTPGGHPVAVISREFWRARFDGRTDIVGHAIKLNGHAFTIVGVAPEGFPGPRVGSGRVLYVPMMMQAVMRPPRAGYSGEMNPDLLRHQTNSWLFGLGLLKRGVTIEQASAQLSSVGTNYFKTVVPAANNLRVPLVPIDEGDPAQRRQMRSAAYLLGGVVGAVLLIGCANIANLLLARGAARRRELAVRLAVGASRQRLVRQLLTESVLLSLAGGALPLAIDIAINQRVLMFSLVLSVLTGLLFGVAPALRASRPGLVPALKDVSAERTDGGRRRFNLQKTLVVGEVALSMMLLIPAGLFVRSLQAARAVEPGFDEARLIAAPLNINLLRYTRDQGREFYRSIVDRVKELPGVQAASVARVAVMGGRGRVLSIMVEGRTGYSDEIVQTEGGGVATTDPKQINVNVVSPGFFETLGVPIARGRDFDVQDAGERTLVAIINETAAKLHFGEANPIGQRVSFRGREGPWREIVGVARDMKYGSLSEPALAVAYLPVAQNHETGMVLYVRAAGSPAALIGDVRREIQSLEPNLPVPEIQPVTSVVGQSLYLPRMGAWLIGIFGALALLLAAIGIYGVLSFSIARRTREMGIRLALGAETRSVFLLVIRDGMLLVAMGTAIGLTAGWLGSRSLASFLYGVTTSDWPTFAVMLGILVAVALLACVLPARRAMRVNPITALRYE
jgi:predicted permease